MLKYQLVLITFNEFQKRYTWDPVDEYKIKEVWNAIASRRFSDALNRARKEACEKTGKKKVEDTKGNGPSWIPPEVWNKLIDDYWSGPKWEKKSEAARNNRLTVKEDSISKHSGGSISFSLHRKRMVYS